jgi:hypothetical protein
VGRSRHDAALVEAYETRRQQAADVGELTAQLVNARLVDVLIAR